MRVRREKEKNTVKEREAHGVTADALGEDGRVAHPQTSDSFDAQPLVNDATDRARRHRVVDRLCLLTDVRDQFRVARLEEVGHRHRGHDGVGEIVFQRLELDQFSDQVEAGEKDLERGDEFVRSEKKRRRWDTRVEAHFDISLVGKVVRVDDGLVERRARLDRDSAARVRTKDRRGQGEIVTRSVRRCL